MEIITKEAGKINSCNMPDYKAMYTGFDWKNAYDNVSWFDNGKLNAGYNCFDKHLGTPVENKDALIWEGATGEIEKYTYGQMAQLSNKFSNVLTDTGIKKGDRVFIFLPKIPEVYVTFVGILKTGAIAGTMFSAFGKEALIDRLGDSEAKMVITTPELKPRIDEIRDQLPKLENVLVVDNRDGQDIRQGELSYSKLMQGASDEYDCVHTDPEDYSFMLYTSGTTGKSKGIVHAHLGIVQQDLTANIVLDLKEDDIYWCTADHGWVTGVSYGILGPFSNGVTQVVYEGRFDAAKWYEVIDKHKVTVWYTAPTAIRMLMKTPEVADNYSFKSLRYILSVGEPLNPEAIRFGLKAYGLAFHDTWWQTETGSIMITNYCCMDIKLGSMGKPFPGITAAIIDDEGNIVPPGTPGLLALKPGWPSQLREVWQNEPKFKEYFETGWYVSGDKAYEDTDGYFWFIGRADDVIMTAGERVGPFEVESALVEHPSIAEAGVIGKPDPTRGEIIKAFITLREGYSASDELLDDIKKFVKKHLAGHAYPREIDIVESLPKTRSGKIMRRVLKARELGLPVGDVATLEED
ncbi:MAG: acetate--CoA ligase [Actinobacteria bacterium]|nr:MAG: acetate--CoA ligase [Actinomycetota bacterium]